MIFGNITWKISEAKFWYFGRTVCPLKTNEEQHKSQISHVGNSIWATLVGGECSKPYS